jgi:hypothetical protein
MSQDYADLIARLRESAIIENLRAALAAAAPAQPSPQPEPVALTDEHVETFVAQYNDVYCDQRKAGCAGGDAERKAMREVLTLALGALAITPSPQPLTLSDERIDDLAREMVKGGKSVNWLARAILAAAQEPKP